MIGLEAKADFTLFNKIRLKRFSALFRVKKQLFTAFGDGFCCVRGDALLLAEISDLLLTWSRKITEIVANVNIYLLFALF